MGDIIITRADEVLNTIKEQKIAAVLSIQQPPSDDKDAQNKNRKGAAPIIKDIPQKILTFWDSEDKNTKEGPDKEQIEAGIMFAMEHIMNDEGDIIIHCHAGKARSAAIALGVMILHQTEKTAKDLVEELLEIRPVAAPNMLVIEIVGEIAGRKNELIAAVKENKEMYTNIKTVRYSREHWLKKNPEIAAKLFPEKK